MLVIVRLRMIRATKGSKKKGNRLSGLSSGNASNSSGTGLCHAFSGTRPLCLVQTSMQIMWDAVFRKRRCRDLA